VRNLTDFFGVDRAMSFHWFNYVSDCPPRPANDRFHIPTWSAFVKKHTTCDRRTSKLFYTSWYVGDRKGERREYFASESERNESAARRNRELLTKELRLEGIQNVIEFPTKSLSADIAQSPPPLPTIESANTFG